MFWSFIFVDSRYLLLADFLTPTMVKEFKHRLLIIDLIDTVRRWDFSLPQCIVDETQVCTLELVSEPGPDYVPSSPSNVPFFAQRGDRLITIVMHVVDDRNAEDYAVTFSMLSSGLLAHLTPENVGGVIQWADWGPETCRALCTESFAET